MTPSTSLPEQVECSCPLNPEDRFIFCPRHKIKKYRRYVELCQMRGNYWKAWEEGRGPGQPDRDRARSAIVNPQGPGTELEKIIAFWQRVLPWFDLSPGRGCNCKRLARWMNRLGPDGCEEKMEEILDELEAEAKKRNLSIPFQRFWAKRMVKQAIRRARKLSQGGN